MATFRNIGSDYVHTLTHKHVHTHACACTNGQVASYVYIRDHAPQLGPMCYFREKLQKADQVFNTDKLCMV